MNQETPASLHSAPPILESECHAAETTIPNANEVREPVIESALEKINRLLQSYGPNGVFSIKGADRLGARKCWHQSR